MKGYYPGRGYLLSSSCYYRLWEWVFWAARPLNHLGVGRRSHGHCLLQRPVEQLATMTGGPRIIFHTPKHYHLWLLESRRYPPCRNRFCHNLIDAGMAFGIKKPGKILTSGALLPSDTISDGTVIILGNRRNLPLWHQSRLI